MTSDFAKRFSLYLRLIISCKRSTRKILGHIQAGEVDKCNRESCYRERLVKSVKEDFPKVLSQVKEKRHKEWVQRHLEEIKKQDREILSLLKKEKDSVKKQLVAIYRVKQKIKGYC